MTATFDNKIGTNAGAVLYLNEEFADVCFVFKNEHEILKVPANKAILAALSPVFRAMFYGPLKEKGDVEIVDTTANGFKEFLQFFYLNDVMLTIEMVDEVVELADKYDMNQYIKNLLRLLKQNLTPENVCFAYQLSLSANDMDLKNLCEDIINTYTDIVLASDSFVRCNRTVLKNILEMEYLQCDEECVFRACLDWATFACKKNDLDGSKGENKREMLGDCLYLIQFGAMKTVKFAEIAQKHETLFTSEELVELFFATTTGKYKSNKFKLNPRIPLKWNKDRKIACIRRKQDRAVEYTARKVESVWFSSNESALLGELTLQLYACTDDSKYTENALKFDHKLTIIEMQKHSFDTNAGKIIYSAQLDLYRKITEPNRMCKNLKHSKPKK